MMVDMFREPLPVREPASPWQRQASRARGTVWVWYIAVLVGFGVFLSMLPGEVDPGPFGCGVICLSPRTEALYLSIALGGPTWVVSLAVASYFAGAWTRRRVHASAIGIGTMSSVVGAIAGLICVGVCVAYIVAIP